ncbi:hypothetical protein [Dolichospermum sp. UHCC 0259]|uniref:hypothetical protein n=1 Tax=Dolichospermum sp. UHCC 0259 TaxID=2590010 RepID=UPI001447246A|nr:hypothetical protein [Dolichospermum sp. UHCC 0259]
MLIFKFYEKKITPSGWLFSVNGNNQLLILWVDNYPKKPASNSGNSIKADPIKTRVAGSILMWFFCGLRI